MIVEHEFDEKRLCIAMQKNFTNVMRSMFIIVF